MKLQLALTVDYDPNGEDAMNLAKLLADVAVQVVCSAGDTKATVKNWRYGVVAENGTHWQTLIIGDPKL